MLFVLTGAVCTSFRLCYIDGQTHEEDILWTAACSRNGGMGDFKTDDVQ